MAPVEASCASTAVREKERLHNRTRWVIRRMMRSLGISWNVSQGDSRMQLSRPVLVNSGEIGIPEGKRVARRGPKEWVNFSVSQSISSSVGQSLSTSAKKTMFQQ